MSLDIQEIFKCREITKSSLRCHSDILIYSENPLYDHLGIPTNSLSRPPFFSPDFFLQYFNICIILDLELNICASF